MVLVLGISDLVTRHLHVYLKGINVRGLLHLCLALSHLYGFQIVVAYIQFYPVSLLTLNDTCSSDGRRTSS